MIGAGYRGQKILLAEDDLQERDGFESLLGFDGHKIEAVESGDAALVRLESETFDLVITDYWMPGMNGDQLAVLIKERSPHLPIIMASGSVDPSSTFCASSPGVDYLLNKPFTLTELREAISWVLDLYADRWLGGAEVRLLPGGKADGSGVAGHPLQDRDARRLR